jgi:hypothetical protein
VTLARGGPLLKNGENAYYVGESYGFQYDRTGIPDPYAPPSQPLIGANGLSRTIDFTGPVLSATTKPASAGIEHVGGESATELLGRFGSFSMPFPETHSGTFAPDPWLSPISSAGHYRGGLAYHSDGNFGGARDAWGIGVGWNGLIVGHRPSS